MADMDEAHKLLQVHAHTLGHPHLTNIRDAAMKRLGEINDGLSEPEETPAPAPEPAPKPATTIERKI